VTSIGGLPCGGVSRSRWSKPTVTCAALMRRCSIRRGPRNSPSFPSRQPRIVAHARPLVFGFAGSLNYPPYGGMLATLAEVLEAAGHRLLVFGGHSPETAARHGFARGNVSLGPLVPADEIPALLHHEVDVLFAPMAFEDDYRLDMEISFPSKLADYTAAGLPISDLGPAYCSAVRWAQQNADSAYVVTDASASRCVRVERAGDDARASRAARAWRDCSRQHSFCTHSKPKIFSPTVGNNYCIYVNEPFALLPLGHD